MSGAARSRVTWALVGAAAWLAVPAARAGASEPPELELSGSALGTSWHVRLVSAPAGPAPAALADAVRTTLARVDACMSTWRDDSELSRFNAQRGAAWFPVSAETAEVTRLALEVHRLSEGAFDPTVEPLVVLWGFGPGVRRQRPPPPDALARARARVDASQLAVRLEPPALRKGRPDLAVDLSGVAKGFAVDAVSRRLEALGARRFLVEIGGELRSRGAAPGGGPWRVGVERPEAGPSRVGWVVGLDDAALATSGLQRKFFVFSGRRYAHILDPRTGWPVQDALASVSVLAPDAARADAWATALLVLGSEEGWRVARLRGLAVLFVTERDGRLEARATPALERHRLP
jgi:FAD:protein FMN transferase